MIPNEELRSAVLTYKTLVQCVAVNIQVNVSIPADEAILTQQMLSEAEWALRSAEAYLPSELHHQFQVQFLKRWEKYIIALGNCESFDVDLTPSPFVLQKRHRFITWAIAFLEQNSEEFKMIMNKHRRKDLKPIIKCLLGILKLSDKQEAINTLEQVNRDLDHAKDEVGMAKGALSKNFYFTESYGNIEDNVNDIEDAICSVEDIIDDVKSLKKFDAFVIKEQVESVVADIQKVVDR